MWDKAAFSRLTEAMRECCEAHIGAETLERWLADGFWSLAYFVRGHTMHPNFPRIHEIEYYEKAFERLDDLACWFFTGLRPYLDGAGFEPL